MNISNFVAIDFETMTPELTSACACGSGKDFKNCHGKSKYNQ